LSLLESLILGLIQGLTEFLPVSSSGHLVISEGLFGIKSNDIVFEVLVHFGTLMAVLIYFRKKIYNILKAVFNIASYKSGQAMNPDFKLAILLIVGTIPAVIIGLLFRGHIVVAFDSPRWASAMLLVTAIILFSTKWISDKARSLNYCRSLAIGFAQAFAIMPGISRSGSTISVGMWLGLDKSDAAEFSFLLSVPAIAGATILEVPEMFNVAGSQGLLTVYLAGAIVAAVVGYLSIAFLLSVIKKGKFFYFGLYCVAAGLLGIFFL
jgi:undecaprenyl-diphosphatase